MVEKTTITWDDLLVQQRIPERVGHVVPVMVIYLGLPFVPGLTEDQVAVTRVGMPWARLVTIAVAATVVLIIVVVLALAPFGVSSSTAVALGLLIFVNQVGFVELAPLVFGHLDDQ